MAEPDKHSKTEDPTDHRLQKAKEQGNVFQAQEMITVLILTTGVACGVLGMPLFLDMLQEFTRRVLSRADMPVTILTLTPFVTTQLLPIITVLSLFASALVAVTLGTSIAQSGWNITFEPLKPKLENISPLKGFKRIFSIKGLFELVKAVLKIAVVGPIVYFLLAGHMNQIMGLPAVGLTEIIAQVGGLMTKLLVQMIIAFIILTVIDFAYQKWQYKEDLKMTKKEIKDEHKEREGDPQMKSRRREFAQELARQPRLDHAVLKSDAVVTNPTHYAVGLTYDPDTAGAPEVTIKGMRKRALRIKAMARENGIPIVENPPLARALHSSVEVEEEIPSELYPAVAALLAEIYRQQHRAI
jgi:flagellar biosynthetic protein FlhB